MLLLSIKLYDRLSMILYDRRLAVYQIYIPVSAEELSLPRFGMIPQLGKAP